MARPLRQELIFLAASLSENSRGDAFILLLVHSNWGSDFFHHIHQGQCHHGISGTKFSQYQNLGKPAYPIFEYHILSWHGWAMGIYIKVAGS